MPVVNQSQKLHGFVVVTALATLGLIGLGGLVTSHQAGMAVPDWPTTYGYNMFFFPFSGWVGGIFYEHTHRLYAAFIGLLTSIMAGWIWWRHTESKTRWAGMLTILMLVMALGHRGSGKAIREADAAVATNSVAVASAPAAQDISPVNVAEGESPASGGAKGIPFHFKVLAFVMPVLLVFALVQSYRSRAALHWLALTAFFAVIFQGLLGGLRVALYKDEVGIFHATLAQLFLLLLSIIALMTSRWWEQAKSSPLAPGRKLLLASGIACVAVILQLILGASMRHQHAGLAVPDFPLAHGQVWPATDEASLAKYNGHSSRMDTRDFNPITAAQVHLHMAHRAGALIIWVGLITLAIAYVRSLGWRSPFTRAAVIWALLINSQAVVGALTVWTNKAADIATLHVVLGAATLIYGSLMTFCGFRCRMVSGRVEVLAAANGRTQSANAEAMIASQ
ncbi:MAG: cytochrome c oxidase assembly protein subunit 15 [Verrucomicrobia bacterium]|nr:cytochrome c oxidase assembly protein subunit 15 [Verrucomicrobiota bacterium]